MSASQAEAVDANVGKHLAQNVGRRRVRLWQGGGRDGPHWPNTGGATSNEGSAVRVSIFDDTAEERAVGYSKRFHSPSQNCARVSPAHFNRHNASRLPALAAKIDSRLSRVRARESYTYIVHSKQSSMHLHAQTCTRSTRFFSSAQFQLKMRRQERRPHQMQWRRSLPLVLSL